MSDVNGNIGDTVASVAVLATVTELLPPIAAALSIIWLVIRLYEWVRYRIFGFRDDKGETFK